MSTPRPAIRSPLAKPPEALSGCCALQHGRGRKINLPSQKRRVGSTRLLLIKNHAKIRDPDLPKNPRPHRAELVTGEWPGRQAPLKESAAGSTDRGSRRE